MAKPVSVQYHIPRNPNVPSPRNAEILGSTPWHKDEDGRPSTEEIRISRQHTALPQSMELANLERMFIVPKTKGLMLTPTKPGNVFFEALGSYVGATMLDALLPAFVGIPVHAAIETLIEASAEDAKFAAIARGCEVVPTVDIHDIDWRECSTFLNSYSHVTLTYTTPGAQPRTLTLVRSRSLKNWVSLILQSRFLEECASEFMRAKATFMAPVLEPVFKQFDMETITLGQMQFLLSALQTAWKEHLQAHPEVTNAVVWKRAREYLELVMPAYRDFPDFQVALNQFDTDTAKPFQPVW